MLRMLMANALTSSCKCGRAAARIAPRTSPVGSGPAAAASVPAPAVQLSRLLHQGPSVRCIATSAARGGLADTLQKELDYEKSNYEPPPEAKQTPAGWQLVDEAGSSHLTLSRKYKDEQINVEIMCDDQPEEPAYEDEEGNAVDPEDEDLQLGLEFSVHVTKGEQTLVFECIGDGSQTSISNLSLEPTKVLDAGDEGAYDGPEYGELDPGLQTEFEQYLGQRGITNELVNYLKALVDDKEQREYTSWLQRVRSFIG